MNKNKLFASVIGLLFLWRGFRQKIIKLRCLGSNLTG